ncbi:MAG: phosphoethanolamine--lipid A transferase, partial [Polaromonas sp.]|nr:phosphoethanolamine--lipid A transferase [Polaromonas sp.]
MIPAAPQSPAPRPIPVSPAQRARLRRPALTAEALVLLGASFMLLAGNGPFWRAALAGRDFSQISSWGFAAALFAIFGGAYCVFALLLSTRWTVKPLLALLILVTAFASWFMERYAIYLDRSMVRNLLQTDVREAADLLTWALVPHVLLFGVLPAALVFWFDIERSGWLRASMRRLAWLLGCAAIAGLALWLVFADFASLMRNQTALRHLMTPGNAVAALTSEAWLHGRRPTGPKSVVGADARLLESWGKRTRPVLFVLVVGETARAQNFSLNGYARQTNPQLAKRDVLNFSNAKACGTSTAVSLPCMFSPFGRANYDEAKIRSHESVLDVLQRAGFKVLWRDNQSGCKGVCDGVAAEQVGTAGIDGICPEGQCFDEALLHGMEGIAKDASGNLFVVMHQMGSHGPAYFKRYPATFRQFTPACENEDLRHCTPAEIVNAYDNSLLYTDFFLSKVIGFLQGAQARYDTAMLYVSDHGESLGENGLYLHGMPYAIAPDVQTRVPLLTWLSPGFASSFGIDTACLRSRSDLPLSHDN